MWRREVPEENLKIILNDADIILDAREFNNNKKNDKYLNCIYMIYHFHHQHRHHHHHHFAQYTPQHLHIKSCLYHHLHPA